MRQEWRGSHSEEGSQRGAPPRRQSDWLDFLLGGKGERRAAEPEMPRASLRVRKAHARHQVAQRGLWVAGLLVLGYGALAARAGGLMLGWDERLQNKARVQFQQPVLLEARRGDLLDREGGILATTVFMPTLHADPSVIPPSEVKGLARELAALIPVPRAELEEQLGRSDRKDLVIARDLHPGLARKAAALGPRYALWTSDEYRRYYPGGAMASALVGVVGRSGHGLSGLEWTLDRFLRGDTFRFVELRDRKGRGIRPSMTALQTAYRGDTVTLTIDRVLQLAAERALDEVIERSKPESANIVVMDPRTGEILALANRPTTNGNDTQHLDVANLKNHAVMDSVEPGSVFKPFVAALALQHGVFQATSVLDCENGAWRLGRKTITDTHPHGLLTIGEVIKFSSNIGAAKMALRIGAERMIPGLRDFGFGRATDLGILGEVPGTLRSAASIKTIELATTSYGQGVTASTVQLAAAVSTIANHGVRMQPHLVREVRDRQGDVVLENLPTEDRRVLDADVADAVARMMVSVTEDGGTATRAQVPGYTVAGKTGTAWKVVNKHYSSTARIAAFIGFLPAEDPRLAIAVIVDTPHEGSRYGGLAAAPAFASMGRIGMRHLGIAATASVEADGPSAGLDPSTELAAVGERGSGAVGFWSPVNLDEELPSLLWANGEQLLLPDLSGLSMRDVLVTLQGSGLELGLVGHGMAVKQTPEAGALLRAGERVEVRFQ